jgi:hypothetical protein
VRSAIFDPAELELLATPLSVRLERAAKDRDAATARELADLIEHEHLSAYDSYLHWIAVLHSFISAEAGEHEQQEALTFAAAKAFPTFLLPYRGAEPRPRALAVARQLRAAGATFEFEETAASMRFNVSAWGSARLWREAAARRRSGDRYVFRTYGANDSDGVGFTRFMAADELFYKGLALGVMPATPEAQAVLEVAKARESQLFSEVELQTLAAPLSIQVEAASEAGDWDRLLGIAADLDHELVAAKDPMSLLITALLSWIARELGEEAVERVLQRTASVVMQPFLDSVDSLNAADAVRFMAASKRAHGSTFWIEEEEKYFLFHGNPLGACGRLWATRRLSFDRISENRIRYPTFGVYDAPLSLHRVHRPAPMTAGGVNYPIYACHCHVLHEIYPIDVLGHPIWTEEHPFDGRLAETRQLHYKDAGAWPDIYYTRVSRSKV